jgi:hypothetical protein
MLFTHYRNKLMALLSIRPQSNKSSDVLFAVDYFVVLFAGSCQYSTVHVQRSLERYRSCAAPYRSSREPNA